MRVRALVIAAMVSVASHAAAGVTAAGPWHADVVPPRAGLPAVSVDAGYVGPYLPPLNTPISLGATASSVPFDGYIGFRFSVRGSRTMDVPVVSRAKLRPGEKWTFTTFANQKRCCAVTATIPREIEVEWRDKTLRRIGSASAGAPPWTAWADGLLPLRVAATEGESTPAAALGRTAHVESASALSDRAQWYAGFSDVVIPLATWLDLRANVREAIFGSGITIFFYGFPRADQQVDAIGGAVLPVVFRTGATSYIAPWPYGAVAKAAPLSWSAKQDTGKLGPDLNPYIAANSAAVWGADEAAVSHALPALVRPPAAPVIDAAALTTYETEGMSLVSMPLREYLRVFSGAATSILALCLAVAAWLLLRRKPRFAIALAVVLAAGFLLAARDRIRPAAGVKEHDLRSVVAPGIVDHLHIWRAYGPAPVTAGADAATRTALTGDYGMQEDAEVRTSATAPSMGTMIHDRDWDGIARWSYRRELASTAAPSAPTGSEHQRFTMARQMTDFHSPAFRFSDRGPDASWVTGELMPAGNNALSCAFVLPSDPGWKGSAVLSAANALAGREVEITWAGGSTKLMLSRTRLADHPACVVPPAVADDIARHGGVGIATIPNAQTTAPFSHRMAVQIREQKP